MQNKFNSVYSGLDELLIAEKYRNNYNKFIVENCFKKVELPNTLIDFGSGIGTLSVILKKMFNISPVCIEIDDENIGDLGDIIADENKDDIGIIADFYSNIGDDFTDDNNIGDINDENNININNNVYSNTGDLNVYIKRNNNKTVLRTILSSCCVEQQKNCLFWKNTAQTCIVCHKLL